MTWKPTSGAGRDFLESCNAYGSIPDYPVWANRRVERIDLAGFMENTFGISWDDSTTRIDGRPVRKAMWNRVEDEAAARTMQERIETWINGQGDCGIPDCTMPASVAAGGLSIIESMGIDPRRLLMLTIHSVMIEDGIRSIRLHRTWPERIVSVNARISKDVRWKDGILHVRGHSAPTIMRKAMAGRPLQDYAEVPGLHGVTIQRLEPMADGDVCMRICTSDEKRIERLDRTADVERILAFRRNRKQ